MDSASFVMIHGVGERARRAIAGVPIPMLLLSSCLGAEPYVSGAVERDSAGVVIVDNAGPYPVWSLAPDAAVRIGTVDGDPAYQLHNVRFAAELADGRIVLIDGGGMQVRWYTATGRHRSSIGSRGEGPGEFGSISSALLTAADTLLIHDARNQRVTWVSPAEVMARHQAVAQAAGDGVQLLRSSGADELVVAHTRPAFNLGGFEFNYARDTLLILRHAGPRSDTIARLLGRESTTWVDYVNGRPRATMQMDLPFGFGTLVAATPRHIVVADAEHSQLAFLDDAGRLERISRRGDTAPAPVTRADRARYVERAVEAARGSGGAAGVLRRAAEDRLALVPSGRTIPLFDRVVVDLDNRIWVRDYMQGATSPQAQNWTVYDETGRIVARVTTPPGLTVMQIARRHVIGVERDEWDVQYVVAYSLDRGEN